MTGPALDGWCSVCGWEGPFAFERKPRKVERDFACGRCRAVLVHQAVAAVLVDELGLGRSLSLKALVAAPHMQDVAVLNIGREGPVRNRLKLLEHYEESTFLTEEPLGAELEQRPRRTNQDHGRLTYDDGSFDLLTSSHVLEHVPDPGRAFGEALRVLRPGGRYVFTVPTNRGHQPTVRRAQLVDGEVMHVLPARYHKSPEGVPALVWTDFGTDVVDVLTQVGFLASIRRPHLCLAAARHHFVVVATKPGVPHWLRPSTIDLRDTAPRLDSSALA